MTPLWTSYPCVPPADSRLCLSPLLHLYGLLAASVYTDIRYHPQHSSIRTTHTRTHTHPNPSTMASNEAPAGSTKPAPAPTSSTVQLKGEAEKGQHQQDAPIVPIARHPRKFLVAVDPLAKHGQSEVSRSRSRLVVRYSVVP